MRPGEAPRVLDLLEVYWPNQWSPRNTRAWKEVVMEELDTMLADWTLDDVLTTIRALGRTQERTPSYKTIIDELQRRFGPGTMEGIDYRWEQYVYAVRYDSLGREYVRSCTVKVFDDGTFELPKGVPYNERQLRRQGFFTGPKPDPKPKDIPEGFQELMDETFRW